MIVLQFDKLNRMREAELKLFSRPESQNWSPKPQEFQWINIPIWKHANEKQSSDNSKVGQVGSNQRNRAEAVLRA